MNIIQKINPKKIKIFFIIFLALLIINFLFFTSIPVDSNIENGKIVTIKKGDSIKSASTTLKKNGIINSSSLFNFLINFYDSQVVEGDYLFQGKNSLISVIKRVNIGDYQIPSVRITLFEGMTVDQMGKELSAKLDTFDAESFVALAKNKEGFLFPDTYNFKKNISPEEVILIMTKNFENKIAENFDEISKSEYSIEEIVTMASIIEKEATADTFQEVSNVLWKRIKIGMALQVDAPFVYYINKGTFDLTMSDLETDHPYNTYRNTGLTPTPIGNPGIRAILAAANPQPTNNIYFLTGRDNEMYFATDLEGHRRNRFLYLD
ncbi:MAG TPA: endolytic transglycosylase MltG [Candidatus Paceibacterota bacterium]|nr:endolytic transglycosylase MltG [Candidatus Paceibacterota bacterium]